MTLEGSHHYELRLALGIRGGVSLAVWIGGACAELDRVRRADDGSPAPEEDERFWRDLLALSPFDRVSVDVIAGASAGGLNGVILAAAQHYGFALDELRGLWLQVADLSTLMRPYTGDTPSLLDGDLRFLDVLQESLRRLVDAAPPLADARRPAVDLQLAATLVEPVRRSAPSPEDEDLESTRHAARFHFRHQPQAPWVVPDLPPRPAPGDPDAEAALEAATWRLALAARATSSFPAAFEAAAVRSRRPDSFTDGARSDVAGRLVDMRGVFSETQGRRSADRAFQADDFVVADGGILDNIPLGRAIQAIVAAPANHRSERRLVYVQPGAPDAPGHVGSTELRARRTTYGVLKGAVASRVSSETITQDIADLERHNSAVIQARRVRSEVLHPADDGSVPLTERARAVVGLYPVLRAATDAQHLRALLDDPVEVLGDDPFPWRAAVGAERTWRAPLAGLDARQRQRLDADLTAAFRAAVPASPDLDDDDTGWLVLTAGIGPLRRTTSLLLEWCRWLEGVDPAVREGVGAVKARLYRLSLFTTTVLDRYRRLAWVTSAACAPSGPSGPTWVEDTIHLADSLLAIHPDPPSVVASALGDGSAVVAYQTQMCQVLDGVVQGAPAPARSSGAPPMLRALGEEVLVAFGQLQACAARALTAPPEPGGGEEAGWLLHLALEGAPATATTLAALEVCCLAEYLVGSPHSREIGFERLSAAAESPLASRFEALGGTLTVETKLAGNELANFSAFLRRAWRANDWMWGRLDAVPTMVQLLVTPAALRAHLAGTTTADQRLDRLRPLVVGDGTSAWSTFLLGEVWEPRRAAISAEVEQVMATTETSSAGLEELRRALVARRQWEILSREMAQRPLGQSDDPTARLTPEEACEAVRTYSIGAERIGGRNDAEVMARAATLAGQAVGWHLDTGVRGKPTAWWAKGAANVATTVSRLAVRLALRSEKTGDPSARPKGAARASALLALAVVLVAGALVWSGATNLPATVVTGIAVVVPMLALLLVVLVLGRPRAHWAMTFVVGALVGAGIGIGGVFLLQWAF